MRGDKLSLVLPAHNEADNIETVVNRALEVLPQVAPSVEIIVVNDGSRDSTGEIIDRLAAADPRVVAVHHPVNQGYGAALTSGFRTATGSAVMFMDSDQQFDIADITYLWPYVPFYDIVAGYRIQRRDPLYRKVYGKAFGLVVWTLFGVHLKDTDCAFKIISADLLSDMPLTTPGALINTEMLARSMRRGATIVQVGVNHYARQAGESSGGSPRVVLRAMGETVRLWFRLRREKNPAGPLHAESDTADRAYGGSGRPVAGLFAVLTVVLAGIALVASRRRR